MTELSLCACGEFYQAHHPECPARRDYERLEAENKRLREALNPGKQPCDCIQRTEYKGETFWEIDCQCGNHDDIGQAQAWCSRANAFEGSTGSQIVPDTDT